MKRRNFLQLSSFAGLAALTLPNTGCSESGRVNNNSNNEDLVVEKVKMAMLTMQRASWEHGIAAQAFVELDDDLMIVLMAREAQLRQTNEGRLAVLYTDNGVTDPASAGEAVLRAFEITGDESLKESLDKMVHYLLHLAPKAADGTLHHTINAPEIWVDSMYMAPPFLAVTGNYSEAIKQIRGIRKVLFNPEKKLYAHRWDTLKQEFINPKFWGVGNGWVAAGLCRVLKSQPSELVEEKNELIVYLKEVLEGCMAYVREDFLFHDIVDDANTFIETNLSQMLAYSIFTGVEAGWISSDWLIPAYKMREAAWGKVDAFGYVQDVCGAPFFNAPGRATEGQAFFLLMEAAYKKYLKSKM